MVQSCSINLELFLAAFFSKEYPPSALASARVSIDYVRLAGLDHLGRCASAGLASPTVAPALCERGRAARFADGCLARGPASLLHRHIVA